MKHSRIIAYRTVERVRIVSDSGERNRIPRIQLTVNFMEKHKPILFYNLHKFISECLHATV